MIAAIDVEVRASASCCSRAPPSGSPPATRSAWSVATAPARPLAESSPARPSPPPERSLAPVRSGTCRRIRGPGDLDVLARDRILSARGSTPSSPACAAPSSRSRRPTRTSTIAACAATDGSRASSSPKEGTPPRARQRRSRPAWGCPTASSASRCERSRRTATPGRVVPNPVLRRRDAVARRAHEPPRRGLDRVAARFRAYRGGIVVISHDAALLDQTVNKVFHLDATQAASMSTTWAGRPTCSSVRPTSAGATASGPTPRRGGCAPGPGRPDAVQGDEGHRAPEHGPARATPARRIEDRGRADKVARLRFPEPAPCGRTPLTATGLSKSYGSLEVFTDVDLAIDRGSRVVVLGLNGAGKTTLLRLLVALEEPDTGAVEPGHGLKLGYTRRSTRRSTPDAPCSRTSFGRARPARVPRLAGSSGPSCSPATTS